MNIPLQNIINQKIKESREKHHEITSWHASKLGQCLRGVFLERMGVKPDIEFDERTLRVFDLGHIIEEWFVNLLKDVPNVEIKTQEKVEDKELNVSGYCDLIVCHEGNQKVYELKSKHSKAFWYMIDKKEGANRQHEYQLWLYLKLLKIAEGGLVYISKDDLSIAEFPVLLSNKQLEAEVMNEINLLNRAWKEKNPRLLPLPKEAWKSKFCRWHKQCVKL